MSTQDKLNYLLETKNEIKNAIVAKGVEVSNTDTFRSYADKIGSISSITIDNDFYNLKTANGTDGRGLFAYTFHELFTPEFKEFVQNLDVSKMTKFNYMFYQSYFDDLDLNNWKIHVSSNDLEHMFYSFKGKKLNLANWDMSDCTSIYFTFYTADNLEELDISNWNTNKVTKISYSFNGCTKLINIKGILDFINATATVTNVFYNCKALENVLIKNLNCNGLKLDNCTKLSYESLIYLINNLVETTTTKTLTLGATNLAKLTDEEKAIATSKGWTLG